MLAATTAWWLVGVGLLSILAAWFYTGGKKPYGYLGLGEVMVFVFFGLVAVLGTTYVQTESFELPALYAAVGVGAFACAILVANNLRDIPTDALVGKRTLAVVLGEDRTRHLYGLLIDLALVALVGVALSTTFYVLIALVAAKPALDALDLGPRRPRHRPGPGAGAAADRRRRAVVRRGHLRRDHRQRGARLGVVGHHGCHTGDMWFLILARHRRRLRPRLQEPRHAAGEGARPVRDPDQPAAQAQAPLSRPDVGLVDVLARLPLLEPAAARWARASTTAANASRCGARYFSDSSEDTTTAARNGQTSDAVRPKTSK